MNRQAVSVTDVESSFGFETDGALGRHHLGSGLGNSAPSQQGVSHICRGATFGNSARNDSACTTCTSNYGDKELGSRKVRECYVLGGACERSPTEGHTHTLHRYVRS